MILKNLFLVLSLVLGLFVSVNDVSAFEKHTSCKVFGLINATGGQSTGGNTSSLATSGPNAISEITIEAFEDLCLPLEP